MFRVERGRVCRTWILLVGGVLASLFGVPSKIQADFRSEPVLAIPVDVWAKPVLPLRFASSRHKWDDTYDVGLLVSATKLSKDTIVIAAYEEVYLLNATTGAFKRLLPQGIPVEPGASPLRPSYNPTGVHYSGSHHKLFVANYQGNNILAFDVDASNGNMAFAYSIASEKTISPENVFVSDDGKYLAAANQDGNNVELFEHKDGTWVPRWAFELGAAHGVAIVGDWVLATSLAERVLVKISIATGKAVSVVGKPGWDPSGPQFLWPTSVYPFDKGTVVVSDAHTGLVSIFRVEDLSYVSHFGGNGPSYQFFNMPYSVIADESTVYILSTFQKRILLLDKDGLSLIRHFAARAADWESLRPRRATLESFGKGWETYTWRAGPVVDLVGRKLTFAYGGFTDARFQNMGSFLSGMSYLYFIDVFKIPRGYLVFSPMSAQAYVMTIEPPYMLWPLNIGMDVWRVGEDLVGPKGVIDVKQMENEVARTVRCLENKRNKGTVFGGEDLFSCVKFYKDTIRTYPFTKVQYAPSRFRTTFRSEMAKGVLSAFDGCAESGCSGASLSFRVERYIEQFRMQRIHDIDELFAILMASGYPIAEAGTLGP